MKQIRMADGTVYENADCGYADGFLWCYLPGADLAGVAGVFLNAAATRHIVFQYGGMSAEYDGFTSVRILRQDEDCCRVCLEKGVTE